MRFVEPRAAVSRAVLLLACASLSGCAWWFKARPATPALSAKAPQAGPAAASAPATDRAGEPEIMVSPTAQRAFDEARRLLRAGRTAEAERAFLALTQSDPGLAGPHANLGVIYRDQGQRLEAAIRELETAVKLSPRQASLHNELGVTYRQAGQFEKARKAYEDALARDPNHAPAVLNLGILFDLYLGDGARALAQYERYLALSPQGDAVVTKWVAELKNRKPAALAVSKKEKE